MTKFSELAVDFIMENRLEEAQAMLLAEDVEDKLIRAVGEVDLVNYLMKFEQYLSDHDIYIFKGWEQAVVLTVPKVDRFWVTYYLSLPPESEINGAKRLLNDKENQNEVAHRQEPDGSFVMQFKILRRLLDKVELENKESANEIADREVQAGA